MSQDKLPSDLIDKVRQDKIIVFAGAGVSIDAGLPRWKELVMHILEQISEKEHKAKDYIDVLKKDILDPIEVLKKIEHFKAEGIEIFERKMRNYKEHIPTKLHQKLGQLSSRIITTNYDNLLEKSHPTFEKIVYTYDYKIGKMSEYSKYIFKIHGDIEEPQKAILFPSQYEELYVNDEKCHIFQLKKIFSDHSMLFVGFGLNDPYINYVLNYITKLYSGFAPKHYIITTDKNKKFQKDIIPIYINKHSDLEPLIDKLIKEKNSTIEKNTNIENAIHFKSLEYDTPPNIKHWVGRGKEIENISNENFKVVCITGIGGQGKSALAAHYVKNKFDKNLYEFADWRDFKEETNRFQTKLISIIKRLEARNDEKNNFEGLNNKQLTDYFFNILDDKKIIFVFDNIDSHIDLESFIPEGDMGYFFEKALTINHSSKFIFTCRPLIRKASSSFYQILLDGLTLKETEQLFNLYKISANLKDVKLFAEQVFLKTNGHPLWLNLLAAQAIRSIETAKDFLKKIENKSSFNESTVSAILSQEILTQIWTSLNNKQRTLLRGIAETVRPETINDLKRILNSELNSNQFDKSLRTLKNLNLIEIKRSAISQDLVELHPLVKEFILSKYQTAERIKYIALIVKFYDEVIFVLKPKLSYKLAFTDFEKWTSKIELQINKEDFEGALVALQEVNNPILEAGYVEEYLRVGEKLYDAIDWIKAMEKEIPYFHSQLREVIMASIQFGKYNNANNLLQKYEKLILKKNELFLSLCSMKCYFFWFQNQFEDAIIFGEQGEFLLSQSGLEDKFGLRHNLALSRRDSKKEENIKEALFYFLKNEKLENIIDINTEISHSGHFYGNIGRCLEFLGKESQALTCYFKSIKALLKANDHDSSINTGYACYWIFNLLNKGGKLQDALYFLKYAIISNETISPPRVKEYKDIWEATICDIETKTYITKKYDWEIEKYCKQQIENFFETNIVNNIF